ncbi:hypothetical protein Tco_0140188 [Tanacetum coccineum]
MADAAMKHIPSNFSKLDKFEEVDFRRWQKKMHFFLSSISVVYVLTTSILDDGDDVTVEQLRKRAYVESSKELWDSLETKYMVEDASSKKFLVSCIIDKLPPFWKDFKHTLKHKKEELTLVKLGNHLRIQESLKVQDSDKPKGNNVVGLSVVNMVEHNNSSRDYKGVNVDNKANGSSIKGSVDGSSNSLKGQNMVDSGATVHACKDRCWFKTYKSLNDGSIIHMGNESTTLVHGCGCVDIRFSSGKGHVHFKRMQDMSKDGLIPAFDMDTEKCKGGVQSERLARDWHGYAVSSLMDTAYWLSE